MDMKKKLVEIFCSVLGVEPDFSNAEAMKFVEELISHGVTVQEWISVKDERKPKYGEDVLVVVFDGYDTYTDTDCLMRDGKWCYETENRKVTHWQPMPQPPKGE